MIERAYMITSKEIEHNYIEIGYNKCNMNIAKCFILAILACKAYSKCCLSGRPCNGCRSRR